MRFGRVLVCGLLLAVVLGVAACGPDQQGATIVVGGADSTEHKLAGQLAVQLLEARGYQVVDRTGGGDPATVRADLAAGAIDVAWEFTGETWLSHLAHDQPLTDPALLWQRLTAEDSENGIVWVAQADYHSTLTMYVRLDLATANKLLTLSDLGEYTRTVNARTRLCTPEELYGALQGVKGLVRAYNLSFDESLVQFLSPTDGYRALAEGRCDCALASSLEDVTSPGPLRALEDDRTFFHASNLAVAVRAPVLEAHPELQAALADLAAALTQQNMTDLYRQVTVDRKDMARVARTFLKDAGLLDKP